MTPPAADSLDWRAGAAALAGAVPLSALENAAVALLEEAVREKSPVAVAVSGGADSLAALLLVWAHFPGLRGRIAVAHFNHGTRPECAAEAAFVRAVAKSLGAVFTGGKLSDETTVSGSEAELRRHRLAFFAEALAAHRCRLLVQGHHADDVAETLLMRLARGSGTAGLAAPRPVQRFADGRVFLRPLLTLRKTTLLDALRAAGLPWCEDASNGTAAYLRNRVRQSVVPAWEQARGAAVTPGVLRARRLLEEDDTALEAWLDTIFPAESLKRCGVLRAGEDAVFFEDSGAAPAPCAEGLSFDWRPLRGLPVALHRRAFWRALRAAAVVTDVAAAAADDIVAALADARPARWSVGAALLAFDGARLAVSLSKEASPENATGLLPGKGFLFWPPDGVLRAETSPVPEALFAEIAAGKFSPERTVFLDPAGVSGGVLRARCWRRGDTYQPLGAPGARKLSDVFADKKIPAGQRRRLPVVCDAAGILWVPGLPPAHRCRLSGALSLALRLTWQCACLLCPVPKDESALAK